MVAARAGLNDKARHILHLVANLSKMAAAGNLPNEAAEEDASELVFPKGLRNKFSLNRVIIILWSCVPNFVKV